MGEEDETGEEKEKKDVKVGEMTKTEKIIKAMKDHNVPEMYQGDLFFKINDEGLEDC